MKYYLISLFLFITHLVPAQSIKYFSKFGAPATQEDCHYYQNCGVARFERDTVFTYYCSNDALRSVQPLDAKGNPSGLTVFYFENGGIKSRTTFDKSDLRILEEWYPNGQKQCDKQLDSFSFQKKLINYWDSTGNQLVLNGNGFCRCFFQWFDSHLAETGRIIDGVRDSAWSGEIDGRLYYNEQYALGELVSGTSYDEGGTTYQYVKIEESAAPANGMPGFYSMIGQNIVYPKRARKLGIEGKVFVEFNVERDGSLTDIKVLKGIGEDCDREAVRVISLSKKWIPSKQRGQPVRQKMVLPISFRLS